MAIGCLSIRPLRRVVLLREAVRRDIRAVLLVSPCHASGLYCFGGTFDDCVGDGLTLVSWYRIQLVCPAPT